MAFMQIACDMFIATFTEANASMHSEPELEPTAAPDALIDARLDAAFEAYEQGRIEPAEQGFLSVLELSPREFDALHMLGVIAMQRRDFDRAAAWLQQALAADAEAGMAYANLGIVQMEAGRPTQALAAFDQAIRLEPSAGVYFGRGLAQLALRQWNAALVSLKQALALQPDHAEAHFNCGTAYLELRRYNDAALHYSQTLKLQPQHVSALINRGHALLELQRFGEAAADYDRALTLDPARPAAWAGLGHAYAQIGRFADALISYDKALALKPGQLDVLINRGTVLHRLKRFAEAAASYRQALALAPDNAHLLNNLSSALREAEQFDEARVHAERALVLDPELPDAHTNLGNALLGLGRPAEASTAFERSLSQRPDDVEARWALAWSSLLAGDWARGLPALEVRSKRAGFVSMQRNLRQPLWLGDADLRGRSILLHAEQGFGDTLQFCRYVPLVAERGARVLLEVQPALKDLMASLAGGAQVFSLGEAPVSEAEFHCPLMSLPLAFKSTPDDLPAAPAYLRATPQRSQELAARLGPRTLPRVGLCWSGNAAHSNDRHRSIPLQALLAALPTGAQYYCVQQDVRASDAPALQARPDIVHQPDLLQTFDATAALIEQLDLVISVDTSVAHLAGALGRPTWILLTQVPDWRWLMDRTDTPWYPTARLFRQAAWGQWTQPLLDVRAALSDWLRTQSA